MDYQTYDHAREKEYQRLVFNFLPPKRQSQRIRRRCSKCEELRDCSAGDFKRAARPWQCAMCNPKETKPEETGNIRGWRLSDAD